MGVSDYILLHMQKEMTAELFIVHSSQRGNAGNRNGLKEVEDELRIRGLLDKSGIQGDKDG